MFCVRCIVLLIKSPAILKLYLVLQESFSCCHSTARTISINSFVMPIANCFQTDKDWYVDWKKKKREQWGNFMHCLLVYSPKPSTSIQRPNQPKVVKLLQFWEVFNIWAGFAVCLRCSSHLIGKKEKWKKRGFVSLF